MRDFIRPGEPWSQCRAGSGDAPAHCGGEIHDPTLHPISVGAASHPTAALGGDVEWGEQEIEAPRRDP